MYATPHICDSLADFYLNNKDLCRCKHKKIMKTQTNKMDIK